MMERSSQQNDLISNYVQNERSKLEKIAHMKAKAIYEKRYSRVEWFVSSIKAEKSLIFIDTKINK